MTDLADANPPNVSWSLLDMLLAGVSLLGIVIILGVISNFSPWPIDNSVILVAGQIAILLPTWYFSIYKYGASWADLGLRPFKLSDLVLGFGLLLLFLPIHLLYAYILSQFDQQVQPNLEELINSTNLPLVLLIAAAFVAPFGEELFFRGFLFFGLRQRWGWKWAIGISAALFALAHGMPTVLLPVFLLGIIFALLTHLSGSIWPAIFFHTLNNSLALGAIYYLQNTNL